MIILVDSLPETNKVLNETRVLGEKLSPVFQEHGTAESFAPGSHIFDVNIERSGVLRSRTVRQSCFAARMSWRLPERVTLLARSH